MDGRCAIPIPIATMQRKRIVLGHYMPFKYTTKRLPGGHVRRERPPTSHRIAKHTHTHRNMTIECDCAHRTPSSGRQNAVLAHTIVQRYGIWALVLYCDVASFFVFFCASVVFVCVCVCVHLGNNNQLQPATEPPDGTSLRRHKIDSESSLRIRWSMNTKSSSAAAAASEETAAAAASTMAKTTTTTNIFNE